MRSRHAAEFPKRILQALTETFITFRKTDGTRLPVRIRQDKVVQQMGKGFAPDQDPQLGQMGKIRLA